MVSAVPNPQVVATSSTGRVVLSSNRRAPSTRMFST
jgi:hypothetical protein